MYRKLRNALLYQVFKKRMIDIERVKERFADVLNDVMKIFTGVNIEDPSMDNLRRCLKIFIDNQDKQKYFVEKSRRS